LTVGEVRGTAVILGGTGFVGRAVSEAFLRRNFRVTVMARHPPLLEDRYRCGYAYLDRDDRHGVERVLSAVQADVVIDASAFRPSHSEALLRVLPGKVGHLIHISTTDVYDRNYDRPKCESSPLLPLRTRPRSYADRKRGAESVFEGLRSDMLPITILRPGMVFGPSDPVDREGFYWARMRLWDEILIPAFPDAPFQNVFVEDLAEVVAGVAGISRCFGRIYNVCHPRAFTLQEYLELLVASVGWRGTICLVAPGLVTALGLAWPHYPYLFSRPERFVVDSLSRDLPTHSWTLHAWAISETVRRVAGRRAPGQGAIHGEGLRQEKSIRASLATYGLVDSGALASRGEP
jgi:nucleoside-diphosphate-sugar epimerase